MQQFCGEHPLSLGGEWDSEPLRGGCSKGSFPPHTQLVCFWPCPWSAEARRGPNLTRISAFPFAFPSPKQV